jgi:hypothetical protein
VQNGFRLIGEDFLQDARVRKLARRERKRAKRARNDNSIYIL